MHAIRRPSYRLASLLACASLATAQQSLSPDCLPSLQDAANPQTCIQASSIPALGALLPLGLDFFVSPGGQVGLGTLSPGATLDVQGDLRVAQRAAFGNAAQFGPVGNWDWRMEFSELISDFSGHDSWAPMRSIITLDAPIDQVGADATYVYSHDFIVKTQNGSDKQFEYIQGPYMLALHEGTAAMNILVGALVGAENNHGHVELQGGSYNVSLADWEATTVENAATECQSGHWGPSGWIENDYGLYVYTPYTDSPLNNHYGIFLEDQDSGLQDSYAIYSAGGMSYFEGAVGIGTDTPAAKLDVNGDFVASGTKSFVQPHPLDSGKEIRFVCLEGNEAGTYFRGSASLVDGEAVIEVPEDFALVSESSGLTVQLTPYGPGADLWIAERSLDRIVVRGARDVDFDYFVNGLRAGYGDFQTIRDRAQETSNAKQRGVRSPERERARQARERRGREGR